MKDALKPFYNPHLRDLLLAIKQENEQTIDRVSQDEVLAAGYSQQALDKARAKIDDFRRFIEEHKDELLALQVFYGQATADRLKFRDLKELSERIKRPPLSATTEELWRCYEALEASQQAGRGGQIITDLVSLVRHTLRPSEPLTPFAEVVRWRYAAWREEQAKVGVVFTEEQVPLARQDRRTHRHEPRGRAGRLARRLVRPARQPWPGTRAVRRSAAGPVGRDESGADGMRQPRGVESVDVLPAGWAICRINDVGSVQLGRQRSPAKRSNNYPTKYIRAANITWNGLQLDDVLDMEFTPDDARHLRFGRETLYFPKLRGVRTK